ncbi:hypothetical protein [Companilactobacillus alimentarius]|uniref:Surface layer protein A domain-containing protein n=1 Tax=Companilactobacillus alimentarius DSM 20249 TaxID=1423720 RepID=A0A2K9HPE3_9LACO|nr:hypothetical protein [Companilactobacillus alimentarius]AUI71212.1 hypothetical protein LA20249_02930 [Companilactobacillus alimentarius DSM 20249]GEO43870.1 hypothetical protein LAL01_01020 [Companilactobacillus alimentarius]
MLKYKLKTNSYFKIILNLCTLGLFSLFILLTIPTTPLQADTTQTATGSFNTTNNMITGTFEVHSDYYQKDIEYSYSTKLGQTTTASPIDAQQYPYMPKVIVDGTEVTVTDNSYAQLGESSHFYNLDDNQMVISKIQIGTGRWVVGKILDFNNDTYYMIAKNTWLKKNSNDYLVPHDYGAITSSGNMAKITVPYTVDENYVVQDVSLNTNLGTKTVTVAGDKNSEVNVKVPGLKGYNADQQTVKANIDSNGKITCDSQINYLDNQIPKTVTFPGTMDGKKVVDLTTNLTNAQQLALQDQKTVKINFNPAKDKNDNVYQPVSDDSIPVKLNSSKQIVLADNAKTSIPVYLSAANLTINYLEANDPQKVIGQATKLVKLDKTDVKISLPSLQDSSISSTGYNTTYQPEITLNGASLDPNNLSVSVKIPQLSVFTIEENVYTNNELYSNIKYQLSIGSEIKNYQKYIESSKPNDNVFKLDLNKSTVTETYGKQQASEPISVVLKNNYTLANLLKLISGGQIDNQLSGINLSLNLYYTPITSSTSTAGNNVDNDIDLIKKDHLVSTLPDKGDVTLYKLNDNKFSQITNHDLSSNSDWRSDETAQISNETYYRVATNEWVKAQSVYLYQPMNLIVKTGNKITYFNNCQDDQCNNCVLAPNTAWKVDRVAYLDNTGTKYYRIATDDFVKADNVTVE